MDVTKPRKQPKQGRSRQLVDALLEATRRMVSTEGYDSATTHTVAKVAGVSVGSLYQYFPGKEALVASVIEHTIAEDLARMEQAPADELPEQVHAMVETLIDQHRKRRALYRQLLPKIGPLRRHRFVREQIGRFRNRVASRLWRPDQAVSRNEFEDRVFIASVAAEAVVQAALVEREDLLMKESFAEDLTLMLTSLLWKEGQDGADRIEPSHRQATSPGQLALP